jgi:hypothetical protein
MKSSPPRLNPKTDLIVLRYLRFPAFFFGCFLPRPARLHRLSVLFPLPAVSSRQIFLIFVLTKNFRNAIYSPT